MDCPLERLDAAIVAKKDVFLKTWPWGQPDGDTTAPAAKEEKWSIEDTGPYKGPPDASGLFMFLTSKAKEGEDGHG